MATAATVMAIAAVGTLGYTVASGVDASRKQGHAQQQVQQQQQAQLGRAQKQARLADASVNAANQKRPNTNAILAAARNSSRSGASGTMLTGSQGVDAKSMSLGKSTLLGQ